MIIHWLTPSAVPACGRALTENMRRTRHHSNTTCKACRASVLYKQRRKNATSET